MGVCLLLKARLYRTFQCVYKGSKPRLLQGDRRGTSSRLEVLWWLVTVRCLFPFIITKGRFAEVCVSLHTFCKVLRAVSAKRDLFSTLGQLTDRPDRDCQQTLGRRTVRNWGPSRSLHNVPAALARVEWLMKYHAGFQDASVDVCPFLFKCDLLHCVS